MHVIGLLQFFSLTKINSFLKVIGYAVGVFTWLTLRDIELTERKKTNTSSRKLKICLPFKLF